MTLFLTSAVGQLSPRWGFKRSTILRKRGFPSLQDTEIKQSHRWLEVPEPLGTALNYGFLRPALHAQLHPHSASACPAETPI